MGRKYLVTGGAGFIGSNFIRHVLATEPTARVTNLDALSYAGVRATVDELDVDDRHSFVRGDIRDAALVDAVLPGHDVVVNFAAESHVDRSITSPTEFLETNVVGAGVLMAAARRHHVRRFIQVSTDEVYGSIPPGEFADEASPLAPSSPYSASKAAADLLALSFATTYGYAPIVSRCTNNFGPYQFPEKVIPFFVSRLLRGEQVPLYGDGLNERDWLHVEDHVSALYLLVSEGEPGEIYNIGHGYPMSNLELTRLLLEAMGRDESVIEWVQDRPGHDRRYAVDSSKIRALGWAPAADVRERIIETVRWYEKRTDWWLPLVGT